MRRNLLAYVGAVSIASMNTSVAREPIIYDSLPIENEKAYENIENIQLAGNLYWARLIIVSKIPRMAIS